MSWIKCEILFKKAITFVYSKIRHSRVTVWVLELLVGNHFGINVTLTFQILDLLDFDPKIKRGHEVTKTNASMKFECQGPIGYPVISQKPFRQEVYIDLGLKSSLFFSFVLFTDMKSIKKSLNM
jgi:hypothetical protein